MSMSGRCRRGISSCFDYLGEEKSLRVGLPLSRLSSIFRIFSRDGG